MAVRVISDVSLFPYYLMCAHCKKPLVIESPHDFDLRVEPVNRAGFRLYVRQLPVVTCPRCKKETRLPKRDWQMVLDRYLRDGKPRKK
jgi:RNase P subunit RPR2